jgi:hypothetical protein
MPIIAATWEAEAGGAIVSAQPMEKKEKEKLARPPSQEINQAKFYISIIPASGEA